MLSETELTEIERRADKSPEGPWCHKNWRVCSFPKDDVKVIVDTANNAGTRTQENLDLGEFIAHSRTDIPALLAMIPRWQPIKTAPKDGDILLWTGSEVVVGWRDSDGTDTWWTAANLMEYSSPPHRISPTHWMPLPEPPTETEDVKGAEP